MSFCVCFIADLSPGLTLEYLCHNCMHLHVCMFHKFIKNGLGPNRSEYRIALNFCGFSISHISLISAVHEIISTNILPDQQISNQQRQDGFTVDREHLGSKFPDSQILRLVPSHVICCKQQGCLTLALCSWWDH